MQVYEHIFRITIKYTREGGIIMTNCGSNTNGGSIVLVLFILLIIILGARI